MGVFPLVYAIVAWLIASRLLFESQQSAPHPG
jgi:hypothetical protein